jgi:hypothetical protein
MDPSSNVSVSFDPSEIEAILNQSAQKTSPLQSVVPQPQVTQQEQSLPYGPLSTLADHALDLGKGVASVFDNTVGGVLPFFAKQATYAGSRALGQTPEEAAQTSDQAASYFNQPLGSAFGITQDPAYRNEATSRLMDFVGQNIGQGSQWIANQTGLPVQDVENMMNTMLGASGEFAGPAAKGAVKGVKAVGQEAANRIMLGENLLPSQFNSIVPEVTALGITQGRKSRSWRDLDYEKFKQNEAAGMDPAQNMYETGTYKSFDLKPRQEISSKGSKVLVTPDMADNLNLKMKDVYEHPKLFDAYPHLADMDVHFMDLSENNHGAFIPDYNTIFVNNKLINDPVALRMLFEHELSHGIQHHEGHGRGGSPSMFPSEKDAIAAKAIDAIMEKQNINANEAAKIHEQITGEKPSQEAIDYANSGQANLTPFTDPHENYRHIVGEIEARLDERRADLSDKALRNYYPMEFHPKQASTGLPGWSNYGIEKSINPDYALIHGGQGTFLTYPEWKRIQELKQKIDQEKTVPLNKPSASMSEVPLTPEQMREELFRKNRESLAKDKEEKTKTEPRTLEQRMKDQAELEDLKKPSIDEMKAALTLNNPDINWSVKEKGGNWPESWLDTNVKRLKNNIPEFDTSKPYTQTQGNYISQHYPGIQDAYAMDFNKSKQHGMHYGKDFWQWMGQNFPNELKELTNKTTLNHALNNWVDNRLKPYLRNELATPGDPVRKLVDEHGITHIKDLENSGQYPRAAFENRKRAGMPEEGHATSELGKIWENLADRIIHPMRAKEFVRDYIATATQNPGLFEAAERDPNAMIHQLASGFDTDLGLDHLMDELRSSLTGNVPQHLALTPKTLERMTMADAVRHVAKINDYREKQMAKTAAKDMEHFPPIKAYENGDKWHDLKLPETANELPAGYKVEKHPTKDFYLVRDPNGADIGAVGKTPEEAQHAFNTPHYLLDRALKNEGDMMGHCVGCYTDEVASGNTKIFTLRDKSNKPHATVEMNVVAPRWDELPTEVKGLPTEELNQWIKDNLTVVLNQFKGKQNRPIIEKYRDQALDLLNNPQNVHTIYSITDEGRRDLAGAGIIDRSDTKSVMGALLSPSTDIKGNRMEAYNQVLAQKPDLPRFMSDKEFRQLFEMQKPERYRKGGMIEHKITPDYMKLELAMRK